MRTNISITLEGARRLAYGGLSAQLIATVLGVAFSLTASITVAANAEWLQGQLPVCESCHGPGGTGGQAGTPILAGQNEAYLENSLKELRSERSHSPVMQAVTSNLGDAEIKRLAAYFSSQPYVRQQQTTDPQKVKRGQRVYQEVCSICHLDEGRGSSFEDVPLLAGQTLTYLLQEIDEILDHKRHVEVTKRGMVKPVSRDGLEAAAHFFASRSVTPEQVLANRGATEKPTRRGRLRGNR